MRIIKSSTIVLLISLLALWGCDEDDDNADSPSSQQGSTYSAYFRCDGPFTTDCESNTPISGITRVVLFHDWEHDGVDEDDIPPCAPGWCCIPEALHGSFNEFFIDSTGFVSPLYEASWMDGGNEMFFLRVYTGNNEEVRWTSPPFMLVRQTPLTSTQHINLPIESWTCETTDIEPPMCLTEPSLVYWNLDTGDTEDICVRTCNHGETGVWLWSVSDSLDETRPPVIEVIPGCPVELMPALVDFNPGSWWSSSLGWQLFSDINGLDYGYYTVRLLESVPCGDVSELTVSRDGETVTLDWTTSFESNVDSFEIWIFHAMGSDWPQLVTSIPAVNNAEGSVYSLTDPEPRPTWQYWYTVVMVDADGNKYAARRVYLPREGE